MPDPGRETLGAPLFHRVSSIAHSGLSLDEMLGQIVGLAAQVTGCDACLIYLHEASTDEYVLRASQVPRSGAAENPRMKAGEGVTGWVAANQAPVALSAREILRHDVTLKS
jgi:two-component system, response regulator PdtaR